MKSLILVLSFALTAMLSLSAQGNIPQPTHEIAKIAPDPFSIPELNSEGFYYYNGNGDRYEEKFNRWNGTSWDLSARTYHTLNASGQPILTLQRIWDANTAMLVDNYRTTIGYEPNGFQNFSKRERWDMNQGVWKTEQIDITTYTSNDKVQEGVSQYFTDGIQSGGYRYFYSYDGLNRISQQLTQYWDNGIWINNTISDYTYAGADENNYVALFRNWDAGSLSWAAVYSRNTQTGTSLQKISLSEVFDGANWVPSTRYTYNYNNDGQEISYFSEDWDETVSFWKTTFKVDYSYNADQSDKDVFVYTRDGATDIFYLWIVVNYDYGSYQVSTNTPSLQSNLSISPNPTSDFVQVSLEGKGMSTLSLLDIHGKVVVSSTTASNTAQLSLIGQPAGIYLLRVEQNGAVKMLPVVKQ